MYPWSEILSETVWVGSLWIHTDVVRASPEMLKETHRVWKQGEVQTHTQA